MFSCALHPSHEECPHVRPEKVDVVKLLRKDPPKTDRWGDPVRDSVGDSAAFACRFDESLIEFSTYITSENARFLFTQTGHHFCPNQPKLLRKAISTGFLASQVSFPRVFFKVPCDKAVGVSGV